MSYFLKIAAFAVMVGAASVAMAQSGGSNGAATGSQVGSEPPKSAADAAFEPLRRDAWNLYRSLLNKGGISQDDQAAIRGLRDRAADFSRQHPTETRGLAVELLLSKWLKDDDLVNDLYQRILKLDPSNAEVRSSWARDLKEQNKYREAMDVLEASPPDPAKAPEDVYMLAQCQFAEHEFAKAAQTIEPVANNTSLLDQQLQRNAAELKKNASEYESFWAQEQLIRQKEETANDLPRVLLVTSRGQVTLELFENQAPNTVANFISLADQGFYNGTKFHRVIANFMAQGGDPNSKPGAAGVPGQGDPGYSIADETDRDDHRLHFTGSLSMANTGAPNSGGCQFFITFEPTPTLNGKHTVFGRVLDGLDVARSIKQDDTIEMVTVIRKRDHEYKPQTLPKTPPPTSTSNPATGDGIGMPVDVPSDSSVPPVQNPEPTPPAAENP